MNPVIEQLCAHRSIRRYTDRPVDDPLLQTLIKCGQGAATSSFIQAYSVIRVKSPETREKIAEAAGGQTWVKRAPVFLVMCADMKRIEYACSKSNQGGIEGYTEHFLSATIDVALMAQNMMVAAESLGLGAVFIGGIRNNPALVSEILELPRLVYPVFGMCLGWPDQDPDVKPRMPVNMVLHEEHYDHANLTESVDAYDENMRAYYDSRSDNQRSSDWSEQTAKAIQGKKREHMHDFLRQRGFLLR